MTASTSIGILVCGDIGTPYDPDCELSTILAHLGLMIDGCVSELAWLKDQASGRIATYGPGLGRSLLELGVTALAGRLDPTRVLVVKRTQEHQDYSTHVPWNSAMRWQGDVLAKKVSQLWAPEIFYKDMTKALMGDYYHNLIWAPAFRRLADSKVEPVGAWLAELKAMGPEQFIHSRRDLANNLYSATSKGVHSEFVVPPGSRYDKETIKNMVYNIVKILAELGLLINIINHVPFRLNMVSAVAHFYAQEQIEIM